ncbi:hypothetical protein LZ187_19215, partial [Rhodovulum sulfidophilum]|nr:hypothetical protein [Rhodovulum sulfidophilum]
NLICGSHQGQRCEPRKQAGHKTASEKVHEIIYDLLCGSHPHRSFAASWSSDSFTQFILAENPTWVDEVHLLRQYLKKQMLWRGGE